jgi:2-dehydropantoate 2-reductase
VQDLVIVAVKSHALSRVAGAIAPLLGAHTVVMPAMNGVPWWFCRELEGFAEARLSSVDPDGSIAASIAFERVVGCVVHMSSRVDEPGLVEHTMGRMLAIGEAQRNPAAVAAAHPSAYGRVEAIATRLREADFDVNVSSDIRRDVWYKLWGNLTMNPVSAITGATIDHVLGDPLVRAFCSAAMEEARTLGARIGCPIDQSVEDRHAVTAKLGAFKTSMLQDVEAGRAIELDAIVGAVHEIARRVGVATPNIDALLGLTRLFAQRHGLI